MGVGVLPAVIRQCATATARVVAGEAAAAEAAAQMAANLESRAWQTDQATEQSSVAAPVVRLVLFLAKVCLFGTIRTYACTQGRLFAEHAP